MVSSTIVNSIVPALLSTMVRVTAMLGLSAVLALLGCASGGQVQMSQPTTARPTPSAVPPKATDGAIFVAAANAYRPLFEDLRARRIGDTLVITLSERLQASQTSSSSADRKGSTSVTLPLIKGVPLKTLQSLGINGSSDTSFEGKGDASNVNVFTGTIAVTVTEVLNNGNLLVGGERQLGIGQNAEIIRFTGVVAPNTIQAGNTVASTQVADVRLEYIGRGFIDQAKAMPWLQRVFMSVMPF